MPHSILVDTQPKLMSLLNELPNLRTEPPSLYVDLEGIDLGRHGTVSIITIYAEPLNTVYLVDVHHMGAAALTTTTTTATKTTTTNRPTGHSLKSILADPNTPKVFFDVRNDSDALYTHYGVRLAGIRDIQLMELAARPDIDGKRFLCGLAKCINRYSTMTGKERLECVAVKERGVRLFAPEHGGRYEVFNERPLPPELVDYCARDVATLADLYRVFSQKLRRSPQGSTWSRMVRDATLQRVSMSQGPAYEPNGRNKARGPWPDLLVTSVSSGINDNLPSISGW